MATDSYNRLLDLLYNGYSSTEVLAYLEAEHNNMVVPFHLPEEPLTLEPSTYRYLAPASLAAAVGSDNVVVMRLFTHRAFSGRRGSRVAYFSATKGFPCADKIFGFLDVASLLNMDPMQSIWLNAEMLPSVAVITAGHPHVCLGIYLNTLATLCPKEVLYQVLITTLMWAAHLGKSEYIGLLIACFRRYEVPFCFDPAYTGWLIKQLIVDRRDDILAQLKEGFATLGITPEVAEIAMWFGGPAFIADNIDVPAIKALADDDDWLDANPKPDIVPSAATVRPTYMPDATLIAFALVELEDGGVAEGPGGEEVVRRVRQRV